MHKFTSRSFSPMSRGPSVEPYTDINVRHHIESGERSKDVAAFHALRTAEHNIRLENTPVIDAAAIHFDDGVTASLRFAEKRIAWDTVSGLMRH